ncbi:hypothetical protein [Streptomyces europaeiscabiei]|uniref:hypothetical protein n=1 Tax=Streptomyces europaeiscabiei TaxID=146819 RepID=UPI0029CA07B6|nr:hypothetical protein [Streptomyces europaeiscabiei]
MGLGLPQHSPKQEASGIVPASGGRVTFTIDKDDPKNPTEDRFTGKRFEKALNVTLNSVIFRSSGQDLTTTGTYIEMGSRLLARLPGPRRPRHTRTPRLPHHGATSTARAEEARSLAASDREYAALLAPQDSPRRTVTRITPARGRFIAGGPAPRDREVKHPDRARSSTQ